MNPKLLPRYIRFGHVWRFCLLVSIIAIIPSLNIMVWSFDGAQAQSLSYALSLSARGVSYFLFAMAFALLNVKSHYQIIIWYQIQTKLVRWGIQIVLFIAMMEFFYLSQRLVVNESPKLDYLHSTYFLRHLAIYFVIQGFWFFARIVENSNRVHLENEQLKRLKIKNQLEALSNQLNPHFLFNALNILNISIGTNPEAAQKLVHNLSDILRYNLKVQSQNLVRLSEELEVAQSYLALYKARFGDKLVFSFDTPLTGKGWYIVPLSLQILIENAIKHNVITSTSNLHIQVSLNQKDNQLVVINSINRKTQVDSLGIGLTNLGKRYQLITGKVTSLSDNEQQFTVTIPLVESP